MLGYYRGLLRRLPPLLWDSWHKVVTTIGAGAVLLIFFNRPLARSILGWDGMTPWFALLPFGALVLFGLLRANWEAFEDMTCRHVAAEQGYSEEQQRLAEQIRFMEARAGLRRQSGECLSEGVELQRRAQGDDPAAVIPDVAEWVARTSVLLDRPDLPAEPGYFAKSAPSVESIRAYPSVEQQRTHLWAYIYERVSRLATLAARV